MIVRLKLIAKLIWDNTYAKEFVLLMVATVATQLALGLNDLLSLVNTAKDWGDLIESFKGWAGAFSFALAITLIKQAMAWTIAHLAGRAL